MSGAGFFRVKKLNRKSGANIICKAARHNRRVIPGELGVSITIDTSRSHLNENLRGPATADDVAQLAKALMTTAGFHKQRKNGVLGLEFIFSLPPNQPIDDRKYFNDCATWAAGQFGGEQNILSADIHRDEAAPHCHLLLLPILNGKMAGSDMVGNRRKLLDLQQDFHRVVASRYGLSKAPARLAGATKQAAAGAVLAKLKTTADAILRSAVWPTVRDAIERDPAPWLLALGVELERPAKRLRSMTAIFTSPGKGPKQEPNPIGFPVRKRDQSLCPVGNAPEPALQTALPLPLPLPPAPPATAHGSPTETTRERDADLNPAQFDPTTGEFRQPPSTAARLNRAAAETWVADALNAKVSHSPPTPENNRRTPANDQSQPRQD